MQVNPGDLVAVDRSTLVFSSIIGNNGQYTSQKVDVMTPVIIVACIDEPGVPSTRGGEYAFVVAPVTVGWIFRFQIVSTQVEER